MRDALAHGRTQAAAGSISAENRIQRPDIPTGPGQRRANAVSAPPYL